MNRPILKPRPKPKKCTTGTSCGSSCVEKNDVCKSVIKNPSTINNFHDKVMNTLNRDGSSQAIYEKISSEMEALFSSPEADKLFKETAANFDKKSNVRITGDIRHQLKNGEYDRILDRIRAESGADNRVWNKSYNNSKNLLSGMIAKKLLASKGNCP